jgi:hypothetical protein
MLSPQKRSEIMSRTLTAVTQKVSNVKPLLQVARYLRRFLFKISGNGSFARVKSEISIVK